MKFIDIDHEWLMGFLSCRSVGVLETSQNGLKSAASNLKIVKKKQKVRLL